MYDRDEELITIMLDAVNNASKYIEMGMRAKDYYNNYATVKHMAQGAMDAFKFALK